jgi:hypothetical protein
MKDKFIHKRSEDGFTIVEILVAMGLASMIMLAMTQVIENLMKGQKRLLTDSALLDEWNYISINMQNPEICSKMLLNNTFKPVLNTEWPVNLNDPVNSQPGFRKSGTIVGGKEKFTVQGFRFKVDSVLTQFDRLGTTYQAVTGSLFGVYTNQSIVTKNAYGSPTQEKKLGLGLTLESKDGGSTWSLNSCSLLTQAGSYNPGYTSIADTTTCQTVTQKEVPPGSSQLVPPNISCEGLPGYYLVKFANYNVPGVKNGFTGCHSSGLFSNCPSGNSQGCGGWLCHSDYGTINYTIAGYQWVCCKVLK